MPKKIKDILNPPPPPPPEPSEADKLKAKAMARIREASENGDAVTILDLTEGAGTLAKLILGSIIGVWLKEEVEAGRLRTKQDADGLDYYWLPEAG